MYIKFEDVYDVKIEKAILFKLIFINLLVIGCSIIFAERVVPFPKVQVNGRITFGNNGFVRTQYYLEGYISWESDRPPQNTSIQIEVIWNARDIYFADRWENPNITIAEILQNYIEYVPLNYSETFSIHAEFKIFQSARPIPYNIEG